MKQFGNFNRVVEAETIQKNGRSSKSHTSRRNLLRMSVLFCVMIYTSIDAWGQMYRFEVVGGLGEKVLNVFVIDIDEMNIFQYVFLGDEPILLGEYFIKTHTTFTDNNVGFTIETITAGDDFNEIVIFENRIQLQNSKSNEIEQFIFLKDAKKFNNGNIEEYRKLKREQFNTQTTTTQSTPKTQSPSAEIEKVWQEFDVYQNGKKGIKIHVKFSVNDMKGQKGACVVKFYYKNGTDLYQYFNGTKELLLMINSEYFTPSYDNAIYNDFVVFIPYDNLGSTLPRGRTDLKFLVMISQDEGKGLTLSDYTEISYTKN